VNKELTNYPTYTTACPRAQSQYSNASISVYKHHEEDLIHSLFVRDTRGASLTITPPEAMNRSNHSHSTNENLHVKLSPCAV